METYTSILPRSTYLLTDLSIRTMLLIPFKAFPRVPFFLLLLLFLFYDNLIRGREHCGAELPDGGQDRDRPLREAVQDHGRLISGT